MKFSAATLALASVAVAAPTTDLVKRQSANIDGTVLNFALTLEHLEAAFYRQGLARFGNSFQDNSAFKRNLVQTGKHENQHVTILSAALRAAGVTPVKECTYNFGSLNAQSFIQTAAVFEGVGVSAYAGAAQLITNKQYLTQAAAILSVEARHSAYLRAALNQTPIPQTLDSPLTPNQVFTLVSPFIQSCPRDSPALPFKAFPRLTLNGSQGTYSRGSQLRVTAGPRASVPEVSFCAFVAATGNVFSRAYKTGDRSIRCVIPKAEYSPMGQTYVVLVKAQGNVADSNTIAGPVILNVAAPFFVGADPAN